MNFRVYSMEELGELEPDTMGYIDTEGNFWSLGKAIRKSWGGFDESSFKGMGTIAEAMASKILNEEYKGYLQASDFNRTHHLPHFWPADKLLLSLGFCRFFRGYYDYEEPYEELSDYDNANSKQLFVMNYLFALNQRFASTDMENERKRLFKDFMQKGNMGHTLRK